MNSNYILKDFLDKSQLSPAKLGELNTFIFHGWDEKKAKDFLPQEVITYISKNRADKEKMDEIYHSLLPVDLRTE